MNYLLPSIEIDTSTSNQREPNNGTMICLPKTCLSCNRYCAYTKINSEEKANTQFDNCPYGFSYKYINHQVLLVGFLISDQKGMSNTQKRRLKDFPNNVLTQKQFLNIANQYTEKHNKAKNEIEQKKEQLINDYVKNNQYKKDFFKKLVPELSKNAINFHDYRQLNATIKKNANTLLMRNYDPTHEISAEINDSDEYMEKLLKNAQQDEKAIYEASRLLEEKLNILQLCSSSDIWDKMKTKKRFRFHGCVHKYFNLYRSTASARKISISEEGHSEKCICQNPQLVSIIPQTLLDNAIKYAPQGTDIILQFEEINFSIKLSVISLGPKIDKDEFDKIFTLNYRGRHAKQMNLQGSGCGLYFAQLVAKNIFGTEITCSQEKESEYYKTIFSIEIPTDD